MSLSPLIRRLGVITHLFYFPNSRGIYTASLLWPCIIIDNLPFSRQSVNHVALTCPNYKDYFTGHNYRNDFKKISFFSYWFAPTIGNITQFIAVCRSWSKLLIASWKHSSFPRLSGPPSSSWIDTVLYHLCQFLVFIMQCRWSMSALGW